MSDYGLINPLPIVDKASNVGSVSTNNESYDKNTFLTFFPQFTNKVPDSMLNAYIGMAIECLPYSRWQAQWSFGVSLFVAHFITLYLMTADDPQCTAAQVVAKSKSAMGIASSKSVGDVSISYDHGYLDSVNDWGTWNLTVYGQQYVTLAKLMGKGGMYVW